MKRATSNAEPATSTQTGGPEDPGRSDVSAADAWGSSFLQEVLTATYWFDPGDNGRPLSATIRFSGRRLGVIGKPESGDSFRREETVHGIVPGSGPVSITAIIRNITPGEWTISAEPLIRKGSGRAVRSYPWSHLGPRIVRPAFSYWRRPETGAGSALPVKTALLPFARVPGVVPGAWPALVSLGVLLGVVIQVMLMARAGIDVRSGLAVLLLAIVCGLVGAKLWAVAANWRSWRTSLIEQMYIQGFIVGSVLVLSAGLVLVRLPVGTFLDAVAPGMFFGMVVGRQGCFFGGCCAGRLTCSQWGLWASDRRIGGRRIPTQVLESLVCLVIGLAGLGLVLGGLSLKQGSVFAGALATYTLARQLLLPLRSEPRKTSYGRWLIMTAAGLALLAAVAVNVAFTS